MRHAYLIIITMAFSLSGDFVRADRPANYKTKMRELSDATPYDSSYFIKELTDNKSTSGMSLAQKRHYLNEVMTWLRKVNDVELFVEKSLIELVQGDQYDPGVREYALQHLAVCYTQSQYKKLIIDSLLRAVEDSTIGVTALLQLHHLLSRSHCMNSSEYCELVLKACQREDMRIADQITLLGITRERGIDQALPYIRKWLRSSDNRMVLSGSIQALGVMGDQEDIQFLEKWKKSQKAAPYSVEAQLAIENINNNLANNKE